MAHILLISSASAALHKACDLASKLSQEGHAVRSVLTPRAAELVSPQLFEALTGQTAQVGEFGEERRGGMDHIELAQWAELVVVAPCTADLLARLALGLGSDLASTVPLAVAAGVPRLLCPAMNPHMLAAAPIQRHLDQVREDGWRVLEPGEGHMACGDEGSGRLSEPAEILAAVREILA